MIEIDIYRGADIYVTVKPNDTSNQQKKLMGDNLVSLSFDLDRMVNFNIGDYAVFYGETYILNKMPQVKKKSTYLYEYDMVLQHEQYQLSKAQYLFYGADNTLKEGDFSLHGTADDFINLLLLNINRVSAGWMKGGVVQTDYKTLTFSKQDCLTVLGTLAKEFNTEWYVEGTTIHLAKKVTPFPFTFRYGSNRGLYDITRSQNDSANVITRLYCFGGTTNIPYNYRNFATRILLPGTYDANLATDLSYSLVDNGDGTQTFTFTFSPATSPDAVAMTVFYRNVNDTTFTQSTSGNTSPRTLTLPVGDYEIYFKTQMSNGSSYATPSFLTAVTPVFPLFPRASVPYLEENISKYGIIEATYVNDDIYPHRTGTVTATDASNPFTFKDTAIDFDVNTQLVPGLAAKVTFNTGQLTGYSFDIGKFDNASKQFTILTNKDEKAIDVPSVYFRPAIGDKYVLTNIYMPQSYVDAAEKSLQVAAQAYLDQNCEPQYTYSINTDTKYFKKHKIEMNIGDMPILDDVELQISRPIRVIGLTRSLIEKYQYTLELGDTVSDNIISQLQSTGSSNSSAINQVQQTINNNALLAGTYIGDFTIKQGTLILNDVSTGGSNLRHLVVDMNTKKVYIV